MEVSRVDTCLADSRQQYIQDIFDDFRISSTHAFLLVDVPELPSRFDDLVDILRNIAQLVRQKKLRCLINELPVIDTGDLVEYEILRHAHMLYSIVTNSYVWQDGEFQAPKVLPKQLAMPLTDLSRKVELPPVVCHASLVLANIIHIDQSKPLELGNMSLKYSLPGDKSCDWFFLATANVELKILPVLKTLLACQWSIDQKHVNEVTSCLCELANHIDDLTAAFMRMHEGLDADKFYHELRPYLGGWDKIGMIYEGVSDRPIKMTGGSAAQCTGIQAIDIFLQVQHNSKFLLNMRNYMPGVHKRFLLHLENICRTRDFVEHNSRDNEDLVMAYNKCVEAVANLRTNHIQIVAKYILIPKSQKQNGDFQRLDNVGTGGQDLIPFLKKLRNLTRSFLL